MLVDSWAWVEFFRGSKSGERIREIMTGKTLYASILTLAEVSDWCARNGESCDRHVGAIKNNSIILPIEHEVAQAAGKNLVSLRKLAAGIGLIDALIYAQAASTGVPMLTGDTHFKSLKNVIFVE